MQSQFQKFASIMVSLFKLIYIKFLSFSSKKKLFTVNEESLVEKIFNNAMNQLGEEERELPQIQKIVPLLKRGIGIHHGGLLPIVKETTEILFSEGLIKVLFATETFAMGVNMPAHTVIFTSLRKFDGTDFRTVSVK